MKLTPEQLSAVEAFERALRKPQTRQLVIAGLAGTGKTTIIRELVARCRASGGRAEIGKHCLPQWSSVAVCTPTGKAAHVLRTKGVDAMTVHALLYYPRQARGSTKIDFVDNGEEMPAAVIVDEASMLDTRTVQDLRQRVRFVCYVGDHGQLEPVGEDPGLMRNADVRLETIHRQAEGSAVIQFAHRARRGKPPKTCGDLARVVLRAPKDLHTYDVILCAYNSTRVKTNAWVRRKRKFAGKLPQVGEQVICLRNSKAWRVFNGMTGIVTAIDERHRLISVNTDDGPRLRIPFVPRQFGEEKTLSDKSLLRQNAPTLWDFGYCLTVHKSQGSEWTNVAVYDEAATTDLWDVNRWRYTAATRASERLTWIVK